MIYIDALQCSVYDREVLEELRAGGLTAVTVTVAFWEDAGETMDAIARFRDLAHDHDDLVVIARTAADIERARADGRTALVLGSQNSTPIEDRLRYTELFWEMGLRVMQLTYNNQNAIGGSCYEPRDSGLSRFGHEVVREMNRVGMLIDLSHVGERTGLEAIEISEYPVAVTHANPSSLFEHRRNKSDELLRALAEKGGVVGLATYRNISGPWADSAARWAELVQRTIELVGIEHVGIGTDHSRKSGERELDWMRHGRWTRTVQYGAGSPDHAGKTPPPDWFTTTEQFPQIATALGSAGLSDAEIEAVMGGNWLRLYRQVFDRPAGAPEQDLAVAAGGPSI